MTVNLGAVRQSGRGRRHVHLSSPRAANGPLLSLLALVAFVILLLPAVAAAEQPFRLNSQIEDRAGVLGGSRGDVQAALQKLQNDEKVQLWVAYVDTFSGVGAQQWADQTATTSDLGLRDVLLAVAVKDRAYAYSVDQDFPLSQQRLDNVMTNDVEPALSRGDWGGAAIGAAGGIRQAMSGAGSSASSGGSSLLALLALVLIVVIAALLVWYFVRRARAKRAGQAAPGAEGAQALPYEELRRRANAALVEADDSVKTSAQELDFLIAEFGEEAAAPFSQALEQANVEVAQAFKLRKDLDDAEGEGARREILVAILQHTDAASGALDAQAERYDRLRDLERQAPEIFTKLDGQLAGLQARKPEVVRELAALAAEYAPSAILSVVKNADDGQARIDFAREQIRLGREDVQAERRGAAAVSALAAEEAAGQAQTLFDAVGRLRQDLTEAVSRTAEAAAETRRDIAEAQARGVADRLAALIAEAESALAACETAAAPDGGRDPLTALRHLEEADDALEQALVGVRDEQEQRAKAAATLDRTLLAARSQVASAADFITTHRGAVGSEPRTLLAEAQRYLDQAVALASADPADAGRHAAQAQELASRALSQASSEAQGGFGGMGFPGGQTQLPSRGGGVDIGGMVIGGILAGMLGGGGGFGGGRGGGFGGGGFGPPSFGGGGTRMRRGGGGRF